MSKVSKNLLNDSIKYSNLNGISGNEEVIALEIKKDLKNIKGIKFERDNLGSLAIIKKSNIKNAPTISISVHMDEVGFMVTSIDSKGFIKFSPIGGWWGHIVLAQKFIITTSIGKEYIGVVGSTPPHLMDRVKMSKVLPIDSMFLDIGMNSKKEIEKLGIQVGDMITPYQETAFQTPNKNRVIGKAHDNRISIVAGLEIMRILENEELDINVILIGTTQEEVGLRGARTSSYKWTSDVAFAIDVTFCYNTPGMKESDTKLGSGAALSMFDSYTISNKHLIKSVENIAKNNKIKYTFDSMTGGGTDAGAIQLTKDGIKVMTISIPSRYMHSHVSMIDLQDVQSVVDLMVLYLKEFNKKTLEGFKYK
ncbi:MAG: M42 family metallopeptidase [Mycoplasmataceae bacterium]|nr:M42 family metallopeptidase [Mycoplasmataceae bacterium]